MRLLEKGRTTPFQKDIIQNIVKYIDDFLKSSPSEPCYILYINVNINDDDDTVYIL